MKLMQMSNYEGHVMSVMKNVFGYENFKNNIQRNAIISICEGAKYVFISMPPGFGRSLCYQLPALIQKKVGIIFSPKLSAMKKEIDFLRSKNINVGLLSRSSKEKERYNILKDLTSVSPKIVLLYVTTEMNTLTYFKKLVILLQERNLLSYIVFNESHCLSEWGYDFKPGYKDINVFNDKLKFVPKIAVTTTVTDKVTKDICKFLTLEDPKVFKIPIQQINVHLDVWFLDLLSDPFEHLKTFIVGVLGLFNSSAHKIDEGFGIIYCREIATAELLQNKLSALGISTLVCHHGLKKSMRHIIESEWVSEKIHVIITTYDYGFIHKKSIRCIVHWTIPENIAKYYRECTQIHSENDYTYCRIYFSMKEHSSVKHVIENRKIMNDIEHIWKRLSEYDKFVSYCLLIMCRHVAVNQYFGHIIASCKTNCDVCKNEEIVKIRVHKFIAYSESLEGIKYNICDINEDVKKQQTIVEKRSNTVSKFTEQSGIIPQVKEEPKNSSEIEHKLLKSVSKKITVNTDNDVECIKQWDDKFSLNKKERLLAEKISLKKVHQSVESGIQSNAKNTAKTAKDNSRTIQLSQHAIAQSLLDKYKLDRTVISLKMISCSSQNNIYQSTKPKIININPCNNKHKDEQRCKPSSSKVLKNDDEIKVCKEKDRVSKQNSGGSSTIEDKQLDKNLRKRFASADACPEDYKLKRRKLEHENKSTTGTGINRDRGNAFDSCFEWIKDDSNEKPTHEHVTIERVMNTFSLDKHSITITLRKK
ncbi:ATP-dependent DNA helicase Q5-like [Bombus flavifrons]|uniref:ATP-dependent DNA helicase Q5-like n=1 Tax=Bombus flavifrons TaxID=103934 RepID=UPI0037044656